MEYCFYQVFGGKKYPIIPGWGDCTICKPDEKNRQCKGYLPINVSFSDVEDGENEGSGEAEAEEREPAQERPAVA